MVFELSDSARLDLLVALDVLIFHCSQALEIFDPDSELYLYFEGEKTRLELLKSRIKEGFEKNEKLS